MNQFADDFFHILIENRTLLNQHWSHSNGIVYKLSGPLWPDDFHKSGFAWVIEAKSCFEFIQSLCRTSDQKSNHGWESKQLFWIEKQSENRILIPPKVAISDWCIAWSY